MQEAIALLRIDDENHDSSGYGPDIVIDDEDFTGGSGSEDIWDIISEEEDDYSSDYLENSNHPDDALREPGFNRNWLSQKAFGFASRKSGLNATELEQQIVALLASDSHGICICAMIETEY